MALPQKNLMALRHPTLRAWRQVGRQYSLVTVVLDPHAQVGRTAEFLALISGKVRLAVRAAHPAG